jgi:hypothetical protein
MLGYFEAALQVAPHWPPIKGTELVRGRSHHHVCPHLEVQHGDYGRAFNGRWDMPCPAQFGGAPVTNNPQQQERALAPMAQTGEPLFRAWASFFECAEPRSRKTPTWFAFDETRPLAVFAGIWTTWHGTRRTKAIPVERERFRVQEDQPRQKSLKRAGDNSVYWTVC